VKQLPTVFLRRRQLRSHYLAPVEPVVLWEAALTYCTSFGAAFLIVCRVEPMRPHGSLVTS